MSLAKDYMILTDTDRDDLAQEVRVMIEKRWQPQGGVSIAIVVSEDRKGYDDSHLIYAQAMVRPM